LCDKFDNWFLNRWQDLSVVQRKKPPRKEPMVKTILRIAKDVKVLPDSKRGFLLTSKEPFDKWGNIVLNTGNRKSVMIWLFKGLVGNIFLIAAFKSF
jgi:hypothetical protein